MMHDTCITPETKKRSIIKDDILYRQYYNDTGQVSHLQVLLPGQLLKVLLQTLHGTAGKHPGVAKRMHEIRQKYYFPSIATYVRNWVRDCEICIQDKRINNTRITPELIHIPEWDLGPEDFMQIDLLPELPPSGGMRTSLRQKMFFQDTHLPIQYLTPRQ